jgi:hypothetical protein
MASDIGGGSSACRSDFRTLKQFFCFEMTKEGGHQLGGDDIAVDGSVAEALEVFDFIGCCFELDGSGFVFDHGKSQLTGPLSEFTADQLGRFFGGECFHHILMLSA